MASVVSAVTHPAHTWGFACPPGTAGLWLPCGSATGREEMPGSPSSWDVSLSLGRHSSSSFLMPDKSLKFKARLVRPQQSKNETNKGGRGCGRAMPKTSLLELLRPLWWPIAASQQPLHCPLAEVAWYSCVCCDPFCTSQALNTSLQGPRTRAVGLAACSVSRHPELGLWWSCRTNYRVIQLVGTSHGFPCWFWPRVELIFFQSGLYGAVFSVKKIKLTLCCLRTAQLPSL